MHGGAVQFGNATLACVCKLMGFVDSKGPRLLFKDLSLTTSLPAHSHPQLNGEFTLSEDIADNGGLKQAYAAYRKHLGHLPRSQLWPGEYDGLTEDQLFFYGYAHVGIKKDNLIA